MKRNTFLSVLIVSALIFGVVLAARAESGATLYFTPSSSTHKVADEFDVQLKLSAPELITSLKVYIAYDPVVFSVVNFRVNETAFPFWWEKQSSSGLLKLQASVPTPGVQGEHIVATLRLKAGDKLGAGVISVIPSSLILKPNDENIFRPVPFSSAHFLVEQTSLLGSDLFSYLFAGLVALVFLGVIIFMRSKKKNEQ